MKLKFIAGKSVVTLGKFHTVYNFDQRYMWSVFKRYIREHPMSWIVI